MKIILIRDRLGNQMFQYALYKELKHRGQDIKLSLDFVNKHPELQEYELENAFDLKPEFASDEELEFCLKKHGGIYGTLRNKLTASKGKDLFSEIQRGCNHDVFLADNIVLNGWWQSERYFSSVFNDLEKDFIFKPIEDERNKALVDSIQNSDSVGIHVRKTDYLSAGNKSYRGEICGPDYYVRAIDHVEKTAGNKTYYLFTDDEEWVKSNLKLPENTILVDNNRGCESFRDMQLMSKCKKLIIANSTFSWWAGWIGEKHGQKVIAPKKWCNDSKRYTNSLSLERWEKI